MERSEKGEKRREKCGGGERREQRGENSSSILPQIKTGSR
jgi:hypothetical protein